MVRPLSLLFVLALVTFCLASKWDIKMYEQSSNTCNDVDEGCQICTSSTGAKISIKIACDGEESQGVSACTTSIYTTEDCTGSVFSSNSILIFDDTEAEDECAYLTENTLTGSCTFVATPNSNTIIISSVIIIVTVLIVIGIIAGTAFLIQRKRKSARSVAPSYDE